MTALLQLASLPDSLMSPLLATGVRVRQMHDRSLEQIEEAAATTCATNSELLRFLTIVKNHIHSLDCLSMSFIGFLLIRINIVDF